MGSFRTFALRSAALCLVGLVGELDGPNTQLLLDLLTSGPCTSYRGSEGLQIKMLRVAP
jgi:hypothetical protein